MSAATSCSCTRRAYGSGAPYNTAMRSSRTPARTASTTRRTTARTSSSGSDAETTRTRSTTGAPTGALHLRAVLDPEAGQRRAHGGVGARVAGGARDHGDGHAGGQGAHHRRRWWCEVLRQVDDDRTEIGEQRRALGDGVDRRVHEVTLVVPRRFERRAHGAAEPHDVGRPAAGTRQCVERGRVERGELAVGVDERGLGGGMLGHRPEHPGRVGEDGAHRGGEHRGGHRASARAREAGRPQQFGQAVRGDERDPGDAVGALGDPAEGAARQQAASSDPHVVRGDDHGHRRERIALLARDHRVEQRTRRRLAVGDGHEGRRHRPGSYGGHADRGGGRPSCSASSAVRSSRWTMRSPSGWFGLPTSAQGPCGISFG